MVLVLVRELGLWQQQQVGRDAFVDEEGRKVGDHLELDGQQMYDMTVRCRLTEESTSSSDPRSCASDSSSISTSWMTGGGSTHGLVAFVTPFTF